MSPAKMLSFVKKMEGQAGRQDVHRVCKSSRDLYNGSQCAVVWTLGFYSYIYVSLFYVT